MLDNREMSAKGQDWSEAPPRSKAVYLICGVLVGALLAAGFVLRSPLPGLAQFALVALGSAASGWSSLRWGDSAWHWLSDRMRWLW